MLVCAGISAAFGGEPDYRYRSSVTEVRLTFSALDQNNHGIANLQAGDIAIVDKDVIVRNFQSFNRAEWTKLEIAILVDASASVGPRFRQEIAEVLGLLSQTAGIPEENIALFSFDDSRPFMVCGGNCRSFRTTQALPAAHAHGLTPLFDAAVLATNYLAQHGSNAHKVMIVFSDGADTISRYSLADAINAAAENDVQIDCVDLNESGRSTPASAVLQSIANGSGGRYFPAPSSTATVMDAILEGFRASYTVSYRLPTHATGFHTVKVLPTHNLNLQFRSRSGYYYPDQAR